MSACSAISRRNGRNYAAGVIAEDIIANIYTEQGYILRHTRWRSVGGELDLVITDGEQLIFCEVKQSKTLDQALQRVTPTKQRRIFNTAQAYMAKEGFNQLTDIRFDVCVVDGQGQTHIMENALMC